MGFDLVDGDFMLTWQPTWALGANTALGIRGTIGVAGGLISPSASDPRENYLLLGLDFTRATGNQLWSSWGAMAGWYHKQLVPDRRGGRSSGSHLLANALKPRAGFAASRLPKAFSLVLLAVMLARNAATKDEQPPDRREPDAAAEIPVVFERCPPASGLCVRGFDGQQTRAAGHFTPGDFAALEAPKIDSLERCRQGAKLIARGAPL
ncbi:MAG: hypothetical protein AMS22_15820, partial [Thiotrichales bacterium SG8_50]